jgi:general secretion pathway protein L
VKIVGLNIDQGRVAVSVVVTGLRQKTEFIDSFNRAFATDAELVDILKEKSAEWAGARIVSSIPGRHFSQRIVHFPFVDRKRIEKALPFEIEDSLPFPLDEVEIDHFILDKAEKNADKKTEASVLGMLLPKTVLRRHLDLLASAGIDPQVIVPSYIGLYFVSKMVPVEGSAVLIDGSDLCTKSGSSITACRSFSSVQPTAAINHTLKAIEGDGGERVERAYLLSPNDRLSASLADLGVAVEHVRPEFKGKKADDPVSLGLALSEQTNFRRGEFAYRMVDIGIRKRKRTLIIAGVIAVALSAANIGVKSYLVESSYGKLDREINAIYRQTFPDAKVIADPVRQLRTRLDEAKKKFGVLGTGMSALDVMKAVTEGIPKEVRVSFQEFNMEGDRLKLQGEAASFDSMDKMKAELQKSPLFAEVAVLDTRMGVDNKVKFRFEIKLKQTL